MEDQKFSFSGSFQKSKEYIETQFDLIRLRTIAKTSRIGGGLMLDATKLILLLIVVFFFSLALGFFLGELVNSYALGFLITGFIFLIIFFIINSLTPKLEVKFMDMIISRVLSKWNDDLDSDGNLDSK